MNVEVVKEIRFAVVMYGGVSLAIYINGVAQEILRMVRATAIDENGEFLFREGGFETENEGDDKGYESLDEVEKSYRTLAYLLGDSRLMEEFAPQIKDRKSWERIQNEINFKLKSRSSVKIVRFVVDILSGSSAGGINSIYLSKAMVGGQSIKSLENLWIEEGNFSSLLNDSESIKNTNLSLSEEPPSLFNSQRMYLRLLEAFEQMDVESPVKSSMVDELDLFVTLTDFYGLPIPVRLFDKIIYERNHRRRLYFKYRKNQAGNSQANAADLRQSENDDFGRENYPFLAFAARCTSSFPVAFEPMKFSDTAAILGNPNGGKMLPKWKSFFPQERIGKTAAPIDWENRVFVDGGTLDNKPFGYAIEAISKRQANVLIDRKLIYIEPKPDLDGGNQRVGWIHRPNAIQNTVNIVTSLPGYETIREDLHQVLERNRLIGKVNYIVSNARKDEYNLLNLVKSSLKNIVGENVILNAPNQNKEWAKLTLAEIARDQGQAVYAYYRLRMSALTDDLARLSTRRAGFEDTSDYFLAIRSLIRVWRLKYYNRDETPQSENTIPSFLYDYDFNYRLRRLRFVLQEADRLLSAIDKLKAGKFSDLKDSDFQNDKFAGDLKRRCELSKNLIENNEFQTALKLNNAREIFRQKFQLVEEQLFQPDNSTDANAVNENKAVIPSLKIFEADKDELRLALREFKKDFYQYLKELEHRQQLIEKRLIDSELPDQFKELNKRFADAAKKLSVDDMEELLGEKKGLNSIGDYDVEVGDKEGRKILERNSSEIEIAINKIAETLREIYNGGEKIAEEKSLFGKVRRESEELFTLRKNKTKSAEKAVRLYLQHFYKNFDSYDQMIFPITYETPIGEGDIVEVARISPADAVNLIDEEKDQSKRKKLAGDTFFSFSAFFHQDWRKNDIMWGRLDAAERLVELTVGDSGLSNPIAKNTVTTEIQRQILNDNALFLTDGQNSSGIDYINFIKQTYQVKRQLEKNVIMETTARALAVTAQVMRSRIETQTTADNSIEKDAPNKWLVRTAGLINSVEKMIKISSSELSFRGLVAFLISPFRLGFLSILLLILLVLPTVLWIFIFNLLRFSGVLERISSLVSEINFLWIGGIIFVISGFYILLFALMYLLKNYIFRRLEEKIVGRQTADDKL